MTSRSPVFERQGLHLLLLAALLGVVAWLAQGEGVRQGSYLGVPTVSWLGWSILIPILHQLWVVVCWRLELHERWLTRHLGDLGFRLYAVVFVLLAAGRFVTVICLSSANHATLALDQRLLDALAFALTVPALYLFYSVARYFGFRRALGIDHFDLSYRDRPPVRQGIFRILRNGMYTFGIAVLWIPGLLYASQAGLLAAAFSHLYIWVHYFCTELPDMRRIFGENRI